MIRTSRRNVPVPIAEAVVQVHIPRPVIQAIVGIATDQGEAHHKSL